ncbi:MAG: helix-turn-helix transcriptional regulator [Candidatus Parabeggiatoa sp.]|nr:helix-turn-helix transcriptional regulator [Candidatus Parabeggiatoa sp.]
MKLNEKIRFMRQSKGWSQEETADKLQMSVSGYANIERGETDVKISRLENIAEVFEIDLLELLNFAEKNTFYFEGSNQQILQNVKQVSFATNQHELEKAQLLLKEKNERIKSLEQQIEQLKEINQLLKQNNKLD